jgi:membrane protein YdbS with pleckstrin-like domain
MYVYVGTVFVFCVLQLSPISIYLDVLIVILVIHSIVRVSIPKTITKYSGHHFRIEEQEIKWERIDKRQAATDRK